MNGQIYESGGDKRGLNYRHTFESISVILYLKLVVDEVTREMCRSRRKQESGSNLEKHQHLHVVLRKERRPRMETFTKEKESQEVMVLLKLREENISRSPSEPAAAEKWRRKE